MRINESDILKKRDGFGFIFRIFSGKEEHEPPHFHLFLSSGRKVIINGEEIRIRIPRYVDNTRKVDLDKELEIEEIIPYNCSLTNTMKKELLKAFNYKRKGSRRMIWVDLISYWNTCHGE